MPTPQQLNQIAEETRRKSRMVPGLEPTPPGPDLTQPPYRGKVMPKGRNPATYDMTQPPYRGKVPIPPSTNHVPPGNFELGALPPAIPAHTPPGNFELGAMSGNGNGGAAVPGKGGSNPPAPSQAPYTDYASRMPTTPYDDDMELSHLLSKVAGSVGMSDKMLAFRDRYYQLSEARYKAAGDEALRSFTAGDLTPTINMFNHMVPNGKQISGYRTNPDGTYTFRYADGTEMPSVNADQMKQAILEYQNPQFTGKMLEQRAKNSSEFLKEQALAAFKSGLSLHEARIDHASKVALEQLKHQLKATDIKLDVNSMDGTAYAYSGNKVFVIKPNPNPQQRQLQPYIVVSSMDMPVAKPTANLGRLPAQIAGGGPFAINPALR